MRNEKKYYVFVVLLWGVLLTSVARERYFTPSQIPALKELLGGGSLEPGDTVVLRDGIYEHLGEVNFIGNGTFQHPIVLRAERPGGAVLTGGLSLYLSGEYLQMENLFFHKAWAEGAKNMIDFQVKGKGYANHCRMTGCVIDDCNDPKKEARLRGGDEYWVVLRGANNRVDHCYFANKVVGGLVLQVWLEKDNHLNNHVIDHNFFGERPPYGGNGAEIIRIGHSWSSQLESRTIVEDNVFFRCNGENEIISVKSCHNVVRRNLFYESRGGLVCRHGHYNVLESNTFIGHGIRGTAGIRIINQGHTVYDNYVKDVKDFGLLVRMGVFERPTAETDVKKEPLTSYHRVENVDIAYNWFLDCPLDLGSGYGTKYPKNVRFAHNTYAGEEPNLKVVHGDSLLAGFRFMDNVWRFGDEESLAKVPYERIRRGFRVQAQPLSLAGLERVRVEDCLSSVGPVWYQALVDKIGIIRKEYMRKETLEGTTYRYTVDTPEDSGLVSTQVFPPRLRLNREAMTVRGRSPLVVDFYAGLRSPNATVTFHIPAGIDLTLDNTTVNLIGRGEVRLREFSKQSIGRAGSKYSYRQVGTVELVDEENKGKRLIFRNVDLRPANGADIRLCISDVSLPSVGRYLIGASYVTSEPEVLHSPSSSVTLEGVATVSDFRREALRSAAYKEAPDCTSAVFHWTIPEGARSVRLLQSEDKGGTWKPSRVEILPGDSSVRVSQLKPNRLYAFKLRVDGGRNEGCSNVAWHYSGLWDVKAWGLKGDGVTDETDALNKAIRELNAYGGGVLRFTSGVYNVRTVHLQSHVWLCLDKEATIRAIPGADAPEVTWFSDRAYRSGLSPTDPRPYEDPDNYLTKQDVGHTFFRNAMFWGERIENVKIIGTGRITGDGHIVTTDKVMNHTPDRRCDKMFSLKLCKDVEIGGLEKTEDMWYDEQADEPYYIRTDGRKNADVGNMLHIDQGGHFVLLATGTDGIYVHDTYFGKHSSKNARDIYDFMGCNDVRVKNVYSRVSSDDIVKLGSDCSLGFTRPARNYSIRNIVGDTNCNLFQIGSETADDIQDVYVDNIYVLGANKAGFSISTNDGGHVKNVYLNSGKTGPLHSRSKMRRTRTPFFISISNRGRVLGAEVKPFTFKENGKVRKELLVTNVNIGRVENVVINGVDIEEVYGGSSFRGERWKPYDGSQNVSSPIIAGFKLPDTENVEGGLTFALPDGRHTGYIENVCFRDVNLLVKGGHPSEDRNASPPEIGVGRYNVGDLKVQPAFGFWMRHVKGVVLDNCRIETEKPDGRYAVVLDDVMGAAVKGLQVDVPEDRKIHTTGSKYIVIE